MLRKLKKACNGGLLSFMFYSVKKDIIPLKSPPQLVWYYETLLVLFSVCLKEVCGGLITLNDSTQGANIAGLRDM